MLPRWVRYQGSPLASGDPRPPVTGHNLAVQAVKALVQRFDVIGHIHKRLPRDDRKPRIVRVSDNLDQTCNPAEPRAAHPNSDR